MRVSLYLSSQAAISQALAGKMLAQGMEDLILTGITLIGYDPTNYQLRNHVAMEVGGTYMGPENPRTDVIVVGEDWRSGAMPGLFVNSLLRQQMHNTSIAVFGVVVEDAEYRLETELYLRMLTAFGSRDQVIRSEDDNGRFVGCDGFRRAFELAARGQWPPIVPVSHQSISTYEHHRC